MPNTPSLALSPALCPGDRLFPGTEITAQTTPPWEGFSEHLTVPLPTPFPLLYLPLWHSIIPLTFLLSACLPLECRLREAGTPRSGSVPNQGLEHSRFSINHLKTNKGILRKTSRPLCLPSVTASTWVD